MSIIIEDLARAEKDIKSGPHHVSPKSSKWSRKTKTIEMTKLYLPELRVEMVVHLVCIHDADRPQMRNAWSLQSGQSTWGTTTVF